MSTNPNARTTRNTRQRAAVLAELSQESGFVSAQQLHYQLAQRGEAIGLSTVYRNLSSLCAAGEVDVQVNPDGESVFRKCGERHHHHLVCRGCGATEEISAHEVERWAEAIGKEHSFSEVTHTIELAGLCPDCRY